MATWEQVEAYLEANFVRADERDGDQMIMLDFATRDGRSQVVFVTTAEGVGNAESWLQILSPIGERGQVNIERAAVAANDFLCGGIVADEDFVMVNHCVPMANLDLNELIDPLEVVVAAADQIERIVVGTDRF